MTGSLQEKRGKFYAVLNFRDEDGKRKQKWFPLDLPIKGNKRKAEAMLRDLLNQYQGLGVYPKFCVNSNKWRKIGQNKIFRVVALTPPLGYSINRKLHACQGQRLPGRCSFYP